MQILSDIRRALHYAMFHLIASNIYLRTRRLWSRLKYLGHYMVPVARLRFFCISLTPLLHRIAPATDGTENTIARVASPSDGTENAIAGVAGSSDDTDNLIAGVERLSDGFENRIVAQLSLSQKAEAIFCRGISHLLRHLPRHLPIAELNLKGCIAYLKFEILDIRLIAKLPYQL